MAKLPSADEYTKRHAEGVRRNLDRVRSGIASVTESPTEKAAQNLDKMRDNFNAALDSGKTEAGLRRVSLSDWKERTSSKVDRIPQGVDAASGKIRATAAELLSHIEAGQSAVERMPNRTLDDGIAKSAAFIRHMADFRRNR